MAKPPPFLTLNIPHALQVLPRRTMQGSVRTICAMFRVGPERYDDILKLFAAEGLAEGERLTPKGLYFAALWELRLGDSFSLARFPPDGITYAFKQGYAEPATVGVGKRGTPTPGFKITGRPPLPELRLG